MAQKAEQFFSDIPQHVFIINNEDPGLVFDGAWAMCSSGEAACPLSCRYGKEDAEGGALFFFRPDLNRPARIFYDIVCNGKTEAGSFIRPFLLGREKRVENLGKDLMAHAAPVVRDIDFHVFPDGTQQELSP